MRCPHTPRFPRPHAPLTHSPLHPLPPVRYGQLSKEERKVIQKTPARAVMGASFENTHICNTEIAAMLECFKLNNWGTEACLPQIEAQIACVEVHGSDPDPRVLAKTWQLSLKQQVFKLFAQRKLAGRR